MKTMFLFLSLFVLSFQVNAQDRSRDIQRIKSLAFQIQSNIEYNDLDQSEITEIRELLEDATHILWNGGSGDVFNKCFDFAFDIYNRFMTDSTAVERARRNCQDVSDVEIARYFFERLSRTQTTTTALDQALSLTGQEVRGKLDMIDFAYSRYSRTLTNQSAVTKSAQAVRGISHRGGLGCFERFYEIYSRTLNSANAMDRTVQACQQR